MIANTSVFQTRRAMFTGAVIAPLSKWCKKAIPRWIKRAKKDLKKVSDDGDWSFKDKTLPWDDESVVSDEELLEEWDEKAMLDIVVIVDGEEVEGQNEFLRGTFSEWNEADIIDYDTSHYPDEQSFFSRDDSSRYVDVDRYAHESGCIHDDDGASRSDNDDAVNHFDNNDNDDGDVSRFDNDDSYYQDDIHDGLDINDLDASDEWTDDCDSMDEAVDAFLDAVLEGRREE